tara:strand:- start:160 stop:1068 length:909 start_codon:yes stop_codon:yes gene_type:complete
MSNYKQLSTGIYKKTGEIFLDKIFIRKLFEDTNIHPRSRSRILIHEDTNTIPQEMLIAFNSKSIVEVSTHLFPESFTMLKGVAKYIFYLYSGEILGDVLLSPYSNKGNFYCFIPMNTYHRFIPYSEYSLAHEIGFSNFNPESTTLYLENQFKEISAFANEKYAYFPRKIYKNNFKTSTIETSNLRKIFISGEIIFISYDLVQTFKSLEKPTLLNINNQLTENIEENILILMPGQDFIVEKNRSIKTISIIENHIQIKLNSQRSLDVKTSDNLVYTSNKDEEIVSIKNLTNQISISRFITLVK